MNNQYLIPANTKRGQLWLSMFRPVDAAILLTGVLVTFVLFCVFNSINAPTILMILSVFPGLVCAILVWPMPNYHNVLVAIQEMISFYTNNRNYKWRGWCAEYESKRNG